MIEHIYSANENEGRVALVEDMLIQIRYPIVSDGDMWQERKGPGVSSPNDECINLFNGSTIDKVDRSTNDVRDRWLLQNVWVLESVVAEERVWPMSFHDSDDWVYGHAEQVYSSISAGAIHVSHLDFSVMLGSNLHRSADHDNTLCSGCKQTLDSQLSRRNFN